MPAPISPTPPEKLLSLSERTRGDLLPTPKSLKLPQDSFSGEPGKAVAESVHEKMNHAAHADSNMAMLGKLNNIFVALCVSLGTNDPEQIPQIFKALKQACQEMNVRPDPELLQKIMASLQKS